MAYEFHNISVLVVEDNQPMLEITKSLLLTFGVGVVIGAKNGKEGLDKLRRHNPDLVIADWMMKPVDGISFTRHVRKDADVPNPYVPIILMTGFSEKRRVLQARDAGVTEFLVKPFNARDLYKRIVQIIERPRQFVRSEDFFGPDRRRKDYTNYNGPYRREDDPTHLRIRAQQAEAQKNLDKFRREAGLNKSDKFDVEHIDMIERH